MTESIGAIEMKVSFGRKVVSGVSPEWQKFLSAWTRGIILQRSDFDYYNTNVDAISSRILREHKKRRNLNKYG